MAVGISVINKSLEKGDSQPILTTLQSKFGLRVVSECAETYFKNLSEAQKLKTKDGKNCPEQDSFWYFPVTEATGKLTS